MTGKTPLIYMDSGTEGGEDEIKQDTALVKQYLTTKSIFTIGKNLMTFVDQGASHSEYYWGKRFNKPIGFLYPGSNAADSAIT